MHYTKCDWGGNHPNHIWYNAHPADIRKLVFHEIKRDGITTLHAIHVKENYQNTNEKRFQYHQKTL